MKKNKFIGRLILPVIIPIISFHTYWSELELNGAYTNMDLLWGGIVTVAFGVAIFLYEPLAKRIEPFSPAWFLVLFISLSLLGFGIALSGLHPPFQGWGNYALSLAIFIPVLHQLFRHIDKRQKGSFFKRMRLTPTEDIHNQS